MTHRLQSSSIHDLRPGLVSGSYPERTEKKRDFFSRSGQGILALAQSLKSSLCNFDSILAAIHAHGQQLETLNDALLQQRLAKIRSLLYREGLSRAHILLAFALIREVAGRTVGMRHFDSQLMGGWVMIQGMLAEMETGEGKTLTATLAAATAGLAGIPVHVITVNDYLVKRDANLMKPVYQALGLSVGVVTTEMSGDDRRNAYRCDITYCSNKQITFDYLRDRITLGNDHGRRRLQLECLHKESPRLDTLFLRGLCFAIVDEADSVLIDEARTPLIISRKQECPDENEIYKQAIFLAKALDHTGDFRLRQKERRIDITERGKEQLTALTHHLGGIWNGTRRREELVGQALSALFFFQRDKHYLIHDGKVVIIDENTGRVMPDRSWERGLHQMIEVKEDCEMSEQREHLARLTSQRFFRRYIRLAGMTGTAREVRRELLSVYRLQVLYIPTHRPCLRTETERRFCPDKSTKWTILFQHLQKMQDRGRPVLIGTRSVAESEYLSMLLNKMKLNHRVLNARQDADEADIIAMAGEKKQITVSTNIAGRGIDIPLGKGVGELGGLHIICTELNDAQRIDRQLFGRCARQGDPGSYESIVSLEDELLQEQLAEPVRQLLGFLVRTSIPGAGRAGFRILRWAQYRVERRHRRMRRDLLQLDDQLGKMLGFSGRLE